MSKFKINMEEKHDWKCYGPTNDASICLKCGEDGAHATIFSPCANFRIVEGHDTNCVKCGEIITIRDLKEGVNYTCKVCGLLLLDQFRIELEKFYKANE